MPILEFRSHITELFQAQLEAARGDIDRDQFLLYVMTIGMGHIQEEIANQQRQRVYEKLAMGTEHFRNARDTQELTRMKGSGNVAPFANDMTKPNRNAG
jgi:hypothetical protein